MMDDVIKNVYGIEKCGIYWLKEEINDNKSNTKAYAWWGICKKTKSVAFMRLITSTMYEILPMIMTDVYFSESSCDDGKYCLNLNCPHATNSKLIDAILKQQSAGFEELNKRDVEDYFKRSMNFIYKEFIEKMPDDELNKIFVEDFEQCTFNENAFITTVGGKEHGV